MTATLIRTCTRICLSPRPLLRAKFRLESEHVIRSLSQALHCDPRKFFNADGTMKAIHELDDDTAMGMASFEVVELARSPRYEHGLAGAGQDPSPADKKVHARGKARLPGDLPGVEADAPELTRVALYTSKVKLLDKNAAREQGMKHFGLYKRDNSRRGHAAVLEMLAIVGPNAARFEVKNPEE